MKQLPLKEFAHSLHIASSDPAIIHGVSVDSRKTRPSDLFFALPGAQTDGHDFLSEAAQNGAVGAVVRIDYAGPDFGLHLLRCSDVLGALQQLAKNYLKQSHAQIVAVTGSLGKTTTKEFLYQLLRRKFKVSASSGNSNSQIGLPLAILNDINIDDEILIFEMGMTNAGQIAQLIQIAPPDIAIVTMVALVHACYFESIEGIGKAKAEIFTHPKTKLGIYHFESNLNAILSSSGSCPKVSFSTKALEADYSIAAEATSTTITYPNKLIDSGASLTRSVTAKPFGLPGEQVKHNFLAAAIAAHHLGMEWQEIAEVIPTLVLPEKRSQKVEKFGATFINDAYNAAEASTKAALDCLPTPQPGAKRIAVFGGMVELGKYSKQCHRAVGEHALQCVDLMFCFGDECLEILDCWQSAGRNVVWAPDRKGVVEALRTHLKPGDVVLLKGSNAKGVWKVLEEL